MNGSLHLAFVFCLSLRKVSFLFAAQAWIKWTEKNLNINICKLSGFPEQSRSRWQSAGCSILVPVTPLPLCSAAEYHRRHPKGHSQASRQHPLLGGGRERAHSECAQWLGGGHRVLLAPVSLTQVVIQVPNCRPEGHEECGKSDDRESEGAEDATKKFQKIFLVSDWFARGQTDLQFLAVVQAYEEQFGWAASEAAWALDSSHSSSIHKSRAWFFLHNLFLIEKNCLPYPKPSEGFGNSLIRRIFSCLRRSKPSEFIFIGSL